jgi:hypothetical protein
MQDSDLLPGARVASPTRFPRDQAWAVLAQLLDDVTTAESDKLRAKGGAASGAFWSRPRGSPLDAL